MTDLDSSSSWSKERTDITTKWVRFREHRPHYLGSGNPKKVRGRFLDPNDCDSSTVVDTSMEDIPRSALIGTDTLPKPTGSILWRASIVSRAHTFWQENESSTRCTAVA